ncbi:MAG: glycosyltransferase family 1 protein [Rhodocyclaceae bacterium]
MKVIFGADAIRPPFTGVGRYAWELATRLPAVSGVDEIRYLQDYRVGSVVPELPGGNGMEPMRRMRRALLRSEVVVETYRIVSAFRQSRALKSFDGYVYHGPNFYLPRCHLPCISTFHDLSIYKWSACHPTERVRYMQKELPLVLKRASQLIAVSEFTRREVIEFFGWPSDRIRTVPLAASSEFRPRTSVETQSVLGQYALAHGAYAFYAGSIEPRKNVNVLLSAYEKLPEAIRCRWPLVLAGYAGWGSETTHARLEAGARAGWVKYLGFVPDGHLPTLFSGSRLFCFPSLYEGFGLPILEAMASGVPVVCSNAASLPEVAGQACGQVEPDDVDGLSALMRQGLEDDAWRAQAIERGLDRASAFSWDRTVAMTVDAYRATLEA